MQAMRSRPVPRCYACGSSGAPVYRDLKDSVFSAPGLWTFHRCESQECGLLWLNPMPVPDDLHLAYRDYYTHRLTEESSAHRIGSVLYGIVTDAVLSLAGIPQERRRSQQMFIPEGSRGTLLDVGCGSGGLLMRMQKKGWSVTGIDVDSAAIERARRTYGVEAHVGVPADLVAQDRTFDVITADHVIEHVVDPVQFLTDCRRLLRPGGRVLLKTPNARSLGLRLYGPAWRGLEPPRHLHIFTSPALRHCAANAGFTRVRVFTSSANADRMMAVSRFIARLGRFDERGLPGMEKLGGWLVRPFLALRAKLAWWADDDSGEEICAVLEGGPSGRAHESR
jgi:2-polyprenyl-3-methyl-5-hydroxy-6-metoxy-1,4-benzoquinol methylase